MKYIHFSDCDAPQLLGLPSELGVYTTNMLETYYKAFTLPKKATADLDLYSLIQSFKLPSEVGDHLMEKQNVEHEVFHSAPVVMLLKDDTNSSVLDLGKSAIFWDNLILHPVRRYLLRLNFDIL